MRITSYTDFSLRVLIYLAVSSEERCTIREIARAYDISHNHLMKVVHQLKQHGYIDTVRGKQGGMTLSRPPERINIGEVVRDMEPGTALVECFDPRGQCVITPHCHLKSILWEALQSFQGVLDGYTLADIAGRQTGGLQQDLGLPVTNLLEPEL